MIATCCNLRNRILVVDDDKEFLESVNDILEIAKYKSICISNLEQAEKIISQNKNWTDRLLKDEISRGFDNTDASAFSVKMHISCFKDQVYNPNRFEPITILAVDFDMPGKNGLEFIRSLNNPNVKIIMLTGKATSEVVIQAFNDKEIHRYISKGNLDYMDTLTKYIQELQNEFYVDFSKIIIETLKKETEIFNNTNFSRIFNKIIQENNIVEYYLADESGSFFFQNDTAEKQVFFIIKSEEDMEEAFEMASGDPDMTAYVLKKLKNREIIPFFMTEREKLDDPKYWKLFEAKPLDDEKKFYYAVLKNDETLKMDKSKIKSYSDFLNEPE